MTPATTRSFAGLVAAALLAVVLLFSATPAQAQCTSVTVSNNLTCDVRLCLYRSMTAATLCVDVPAGSSVSLSFPAGFVPDGGVSAGNNRYPFDAVTGCTVCYAQITNTVVPCCGQVCFDPAACTITINRCTSVVCNK